MDPSHRAMLEELAKESAHLEKFWDRETRAFKLEMLAILTVNLRTLMEVAKDEPETSAWFKPCPKP